MNIDLLDKIKQVETPPFLFNKIELKIERLNYSAPKQFNWALGAALVFIIVTNIYLIKKQTSSNVEIENYAQTMHLISNTDLYK
jgi:hypothetical protein